MKILFADISSNQSAQYIVNTQLFVKCFCCTDLAVANALRLQMFYLEISYENSILGYIWLWILAPMFLNSRFQALGDSPRLRILVLKDLALHVSCLFLKKDLFV